MKSELSPDNIAREYGESVSALCRRMIQDSDKARDAAQEVWYEILKSLSSFRGDSQLSTWIYSIAKRTIYRYIQKEKRYSARFLAELFSLKENDGIPEMEEIPVADRKAWVMEQCSDCLTAILHCLDNESRFIYLVRSLSPLSYKEIGEIFGKEETAVRQIFSRSARKINLFLNNQCTLYNPDGNCRCKIKAPLQTVSEKGGYILSC